MVYSAITLTVLIAAAAFAVDFGQWYVSAADLQRVADGAALAGVVYMPNDFTTATQVALETAAGNGISTSTNCNPSGDYTVCVARTGNPHQLQVTISNSNVPRSFSKLFLSNVTETRTSTAEYDLPVPLGSPENSFGTGDLACGSGGTCIRSPGTWAAVNGFCSTREQGDEYSSYYDASATGGNYQQDCPLAGQNDYPAPSYEFANPLYRNPAYTYDIEVPGTGTTTANYTVQVYDPGYYPGDGVYGCNYYNYTGHNAPDMPVGTGPSGCAYDDEQQTNFELFQPGATAPLDHSNDKAMVLATFSTGTYPQSTSTSAAVRKTFTPAGSSSYTTASGCANSLSSLEDNWCTLAVIPAGSPVGQYQLEVWTTANEHGSYSGNMFSFRAWNSTASASFVPCSTINEYTTGGTLYPASASCPQVHGHDAMSLYVNGDGAGSTYRDLNGTTQSCHLDNGSTSCAVFFIAQIDAAYAGKQLRLFLFDPGEGAKAIHILQPDGSLATFDYATSDNGLEGSATPPSISGATGTQCVCNLGTIGSWGGRISQSTYSDRILAITTTIPSASVLNQHGGWFQVEYDVQGSSVTDRTTWSATVSANPVHIVE